MRLNEEQLKVVNHKGGPALVLAGPGSGKTATLVERAKRLIAEGLDPRRLVMVTFTRDAAREIRRRIGDEAEKAFIGTVHALSLRVLQRRRSVRPLDEDEELSLFEEKTGLTGVLPLWRRGKEEKAAARARLPLEELQALIRKHEEELLAKGLIPVDLLPREAVRLLEEDEELLRELRGSWTHLVVDEFQDTDDHQFLLFFLLAPPPEAEIMAVGDVDQSIYGWRGAAPRVVEDFKEAYEPAVYHLFRNYRSTERLVRLAAFLSGKPLLAERKGGEEPVLKVLSTPREEAFWIAGRIKALLAEGFEAKEIAVLARSHQVLPPIEAALLAHRIPYALLGGVAMEKRREVKLFMALLKAATLGSYPLDARLALVLTDLLPGLGKGFAEKLALTRQEGEPVSDALRRAAFVHATRGRDTALEVADDLAALEELWSEEAVSDENLEEVVQRSLELFAPRLLSAFSRYPGSSPEARMERLKKLPALAREWTKDKPEGISAREFPHAFFLGASGGSGVTVSTVHGAKGLEWRAVFVPGLIEGVFPVLSQDADPEEEARLFYVAVTRAKELLFLTATRASLSGKPAEPSRFFRKVAAFLRGEGAEGLKAAG